MHSTLQLAGSNRNIAIPFGMEKLSGGAIRWWLNFDDMYKHLDRI